MAFRGIQVVGLFIATGALLSVYFLRKKERLNSRSFLFWVGFWTIFVVVDIFPSLTGYLTPYFMMGTNMYTLTAISILTLFVFVFTLYSFLSDLNWRLNKLVRAHALLNWKTNNLMMKLEEEAYENKACYSYPRT